MWIISLVRKIAKFFVAVGKSVISFGKFKERLREQYIEINEIKDWSKGESYFGNGRLF
jgi:hypothetical protein